ncbi:hypothetical protein GSI_09983 [Ganoderma sinense ZZ0214-1]|uniref:Uncharacterized protein n=1 Tax=Ganoderma sinense ZZ0214-1 TaxID=1077348 RepID=A0A2G8S322_9APHY|nr:hypothetical protein GSI_09983 [Ganoderma sinense ZZ0214-1]
MLLILNAPRLRHKDVEQFYRIWRADAARFKSFVSRAPLLDPPAPDAPADKGKRKADIAFDNGEDVNGRASKRPAGKSPDARSSSQGSVSSFIGNIVHQAYVAFLPTDWTAPPPSEQATNSPRWQYQQADTDDLAYYLTRRGSAADVLPVPSQFQAEPGPSQIANLPDSLSPKWEEHNLVVHAPRAKAHPSSDIVANLELAVQSPGWMHDLKQPLQIVSFPSPTQPNATLDSSSFDIFNEMLWSLGNEQLPSGSTYKFDLGPVHPNGFLYTACMRLWPPNGREHDDLIPWTFTDYLLSLDICDASTWFYASKFEELKVTVSPEGTESLTHVPFETSMGNRNAPEYRKVLPEAPLERVEGTTRIALPHPGGSVLLRRWSDNFKVPFVPHTLRFKRGGEESDDERMTLPRILAYSVDMETACQPFDGRLGLAVPGFKGPWETGATAGEVRDQVTFWDTLCHNAPREKSHLEFTIRLLHPHPIHETYSPRSAGSFVFFGSKLPIEYLGYQGVSYVPSFTPPIPILPSPHMQGKYDLWAVRLLSITLCVPPMCQSDVRNAASPNWLSLPIKMPRHGVRAILDTASMNTTLPPSVIKAICSQWFQMDGLPVGTPISHASIDMFAGHRLLFTFAGAADGEEIPFYCDAMYFLGQLWEDTLFPGMLHWSHVRSSNDEQCDVAVLGQNFFWSAFVKFNAPYHDSPDSVPSIQLSPQRAIVDGRPLDGPWSLSFADLE